MDEDEDDDDMTEDNYDYPHDMSQATCSQFRKIQFFVEANFPERLDEYHSLLRRAISNHKEPAILEVKVRCWLDFSV